MQDMKLQTMMGRMDELGLSFMAAGFESYLAEKSREDVPLVEAIADLIELEVHTTKRTYGKNPAESIGSASDKEA